MRISTKRVIFCTYTIIFHVLHTMVVHVKSDWLIKCGDCKCKWNSGKKTADCKNISLTTIPEDLSSELQVLDLSFNQITFIEGNAFGGADLQNLHKLFIRNSSLEGMDINALQGLEILIELDLSNNRLRALQKDIFASLVKVRSLLLNGNMLEALDGGVFRNLKYLHKVELKSNRLALIGTDAFTNVPLLSQIFLSGNKLTHLRMETFERLRRLASLSLEMNPWNCTCELHPFREFVLKRNLYTPPTSCYTPLTLRGMLWTDDQPEAFACKPRIIYPSRGASINTSKENVTLVCRVNASPNTLIAWDYNKQMYSSNGNSPARVQIQLLREETHPEKEFGRDVFISRLTIVGAEKSDEGIYTCLAENAGGRDEVQMSLLVQNQNPKDALIQNNLVIVICLMVLGLLSASLFLAMITCCIYKRFKAINQHHHHRHHHHHHHDENGTAQHHHHHHQQKANLNGLNTMVGTDGYNQNSDDKYTQIKHGSVQNGNLNVQHLNTFIDLKDTEEYYREQMNQDNLRMPTNPSFMGSTHKISDNIASHHRSSDEHQLQQQQLHIPSGEYQPDLLPLPHTMQHSISFNKSSIHNYTINPHSNPASGCDSQSYGNISHQHTIRTIKHPQEDTKTIPPADNLRYANNLTKNKYNISQSSEYIVQSKHQHSHSNSNSNSPQPYHRQQGRGVTSTDNTVTASDKYLQNELHPFYGTSVTVQPQQPPPPPYCPETIAIDSCCYPNEEAIGIGVEGTRHLSRYATEPQHEKTMHLHDSIVTASPSFNYLPDFNQRRELL